MMIEIYKNYKADLTLPVMIVLSGITLTLCFPAENRHENCSVKYLEPIIIKVNNVIAKLYENEKELEMYYPWFSQLPISNKKKPSRFGSMNYKKLKRKVSELRKDIRKISKKLQFLIFLEMSPNFKKHNNEEGRVKLLKEIRAEINNLLVELSHEKKARNKKRKKSLTRQMPKEIASGNLSHIKSQTELKIKEWILVATLKMTLVNWSRNFNIPVKWASGACEMCDVRIRHTQWCSKKRLKFL